MTSKSEYQISLELLLNNYRIFQYRLTEYANTYNLQSQKMKDLVNLWAHPQAIANLILSLSLQKKIHLREDDLDSQAKMAQNADDQRLEKSNIELVDGSIYDDQQSNQANQNDEDELQIKEEEGIQDNLPVQDYDIQNYYEDEEYRSEREGSRNYKRGPYKSYTVHEKERAVKLLLQNELTISQISRMLKIPCKNIKRWSVEGVSRKRGGHRRSCPQMQRNVFNWIIFNNPSGSQVMMYDIQNYALSISQDPLFKASRGWMLKFIERYKLKGVYSFR